MYKYMYMPPPQKSASEDFFYLGDELLDLLRDRELFLQHLRRDQRAVVDNVEIVGLW